jgi:plastocyanin
MPFVPLPAVRTLHRARTASPGRHALAARPVARFGEAIAWLLVVALGVVLTPAAGGGSVPAARPDVFEAEAQDRTVELIGFQALPRQIDVVVGTTVTWVNQEPLDYPVFSGRHELGADDRSFASPTLERGARWSYRFDTVGIFPYRCVHHPAVTGEVVVHWRPRS